MHVYHTNTRQRSREKQVCFLHDFVSEVSRLKIKSMFLYIVTLYIMSIPLGINKVLCLSVYQ